MSDSVNHPGHYGGEWNPYEVINVVVAWGLNFNLGNVVKYVSRAGKNGDALEDLRKARWYLDRDMGINSGSQRLCVATGYQNGQ
jgi:hypothetical protein